MATGSAEVSATFPEGPPLGPRGTLVALWAVAGVLVLVGRAVVGLVPLAVDALATDLGALHWIALALWTAFMGVVEGYRGFQKRFSPRVVRRALHLGRHPRPLWVLLGPMYAMGLVHATRRRMIASWIVTLGIVGVVMVVRLLPQPWRGLLDVGVIVGLTWGVVSLLWLFARGLAGRQPDIDPELPAA